MARADGIPELRGADKVDWFGLRRQMLLHIASLENMIPNLRASAAGIDDSHAPDSIEPIPFYDRDIEGVEALLAILEALPPPPTAATTRAMEAASRLSSFGGQIKAQVARQTDMLVSKASKPADPDFAKSDIRLLFHYVFADKVSAAAQAALDCLNWPTRDLQRSASRNMATGIGGRETHLQRLAFFEDGERFDSPIKYPTTPSPAKWSTMSQAPRPRPFFRVSGLPHDGGRNSLLHSLLKGAHRHRRRRLLGRRSSGLRTTESPQRM